MAASPHLDLDWRVCMSRGKRLERLDQIWHDLANNQSVRVRPSSGRQKCELVQEGQTFIMLRLDAKVTRRVVSIIPASWQRLFAVYERLSHNLAKDSPTMQRFLQYQQAAEMSPAQARNALHELALTIGVHEWTLGVIPQSNGEISLPARMNISCVQVTDILGYHRGDNPDASFEKKIRLKHKEVHPIEPLIKSLKFDGHLPTAVVVVEHRNLKKAVFFGGDMQQYILVMTAGYPGAATREFLHMLAKDRKLATVPFLYFGDHDFQGVEIYKVLMTGSAQQAESSRTMVCPRLQWAGPTRRDLIDTPDKCLKTQREHYKESHPSTSAKDVEAHMTKWKADKAKTVEKKFKGATKTDRSIMAGLQKSGWLRAEPEMAAELQEMVERPSKFRLADMTQVDSDYLRVYIQTRVADFCTESQRQTS